MGKLCKKQTPDSTDKHILKGEYPVAKDLTVGHELVGVIGKLGSSVVGYQEGQRVIALNDSDYRLFEASCGKTVTPAHQLLYTCPPRRLNSTRACTGCGPHQG
jgi:threonine dehydrogenase-like Zn-dependent dehydrogenase